MKEKILVVGSGGREYAIGKKFLEDSRIEKIYFYPGNGGSENIGENIAYCQNNEDLIEIIKKNSITLVIIGPETPLVDGMADTLRRANIRVFGPSAKAARLEGSKAFMKDFVSRQKIPTAKYLQTSNLQKIQEFVDGLSAPIVVKADGLCAGKGVVIAQSREEAIKVASEMLSGESFGEAGKCVVIEEFLKGYELSVFALCDEEEFVLLPACQDHKRLLDGDEGPNTGGMGAYAPTPLCDEKLMKKIQDRIIVPTLKGMKEEENPFCGVLFAGIMVVEKNGELEPYLLEFNVRFGDPECQILLPLLQTPLLDLCLSVVEHCLADFKIQMSDEVCVGVVVASCGYPLAKPTPQIIAFEDFDESLGHICFGGVVKKAEALIATGGRVLICVGKAKTFKEARKNAYTILERIKFEGMIYRKDIGLRALEYS